MSVRCLFPDTNVLTRSQTLHCVSSYFSPHHTSSFNHSLSHNHHLPMHSHRISLPSHMIHAGGDDEDGGAAMKTCLSTDQLEVDLDASSDVSSELSFGYEFAQAEVMMKGMGNNGESD